MPEVPGKPGTHGKTAKQGKPAKPADGMWPIEQQPGPPQVDPVDRQEVDDCRRSTYLSYEAWLRQWLAGLDAERPQLWKRDYSDVAAYEHSVEPMRQRFAEMLGFWSEPAERGEIRALEVTPLRETDEVTISRFTYEVLPGLTTYALRLVPRTAGPHPGLLIQHGYMGTPELACGVVENANGPDLSYRSFGLRAARRGYHVIAPHHPSGYGMLSDEVDSALPDHPDQSVHYGKNRLHRLCLLGGGTLLGLDMLTSSRAVDLLVGEAGVVAERVGIYGLSRGGQTALFLPALDKRLRASVCAAYFATRFAKLAGPYSRTNYVDWFAEGQFLPDQVRYFADADLVSLIAPRAFAAEAGVTDTAVDQDAAVAEGARAAQHYEKLGLPERFEVIAHAEGHVSATARAFEFLEEQLRAE